MTTFAHIETGTARDPQPAADAETYRNYFRAAVPQPGQQDITAGWNVQKVPDGTQEGALPDGQGGWVNPVPAQVVPLPTKMGGVDFHNYCAAVLAQVNGISAQAGMARLGTILAGLEASRVQGGLLMIAWLRYNAAGVPDGRYNYTDMPLLLGALQTAGIITAQESAALLANWPRA